MDVASAADHLYGLRPEEFTAARDKLAAEAKKEGDAAGSAEIKRLRKPTAAAWLANLTARSASAGIAELLDTGAALQEAQQAMAGADVRRLSQERRRLIAALSTDARRLAAEAGVNVSDTTVQELEATLEAALSDPKAAETLRSGRLTTSLEPSGLGALGLFDVVPLREEQPAGGHTRRPEHPRPAPRRDEPDERAAAAAAAIAKAQEEVEDAESALAAREDATRTARLEREQLAGEVADAEKRLSEVRRALIGAEGRVRETERAEKAAEADLVKCRRRLDELETKPQT